MFCRYRSLRWRRLAKLYLARYANSKYWVDFEDFSFYRMDVVDIYYVGGFGVMGWVSASEYDRSQPDPLADSMAEIIQHMNADHKDALVLLARKFARIESQEATMTAVDRLGFQVRLKTQDGMRGARIAFLREVSNPAETGKSWSKWCNRRARSPSELQAFSRYPTRRPFQRQVQSAFIGLMLIECPLRPFASTLRALCV